MTFGQQFLETSPVAAPKPSHPTVFGITLTPNALGLLAVLLGLGGGGYLYQNFVSPLLVQQQQVQDDVENLQLSREQQLQLMRDVSRLQGELSQARALQTQVLQLFANQDSLSTMLIDLNRLARSAPGLRLVSFKPEAPTIVSDGSLGAAANGRLRKTSIAVAVEGRFEAIWKFLRNVERLQPLLLVSDLKIQPKEELKFRLINGSLVAPANPVLSTSLTLSAISALTPEEQAQATKDKAAQQGGQDSNKGSKPGTAEKK
jgi:type IV pilus assembly protein PilO